MVPVFPERHAGVFLTDRFFVIKIERRQNYPDVIVYTAFIDLLSCKNITLREILCVQIFQIMVYDVRTYDQDFVRRMKHSVGVSVVEQNRAGTIFPVKMQEVIDHGIGKGRGRFGTE